MRIALVGYGKMGKAIEEIAVERGHEIVLRSTSKNPITPDQLKNIDAAIEFSIPATVLNNIDLLLDAGIPTVVGTTGWNHALESVGEKVADKEGALLHSSNFSIGVNIFFKVNEYLAKIMNKQEAYACDMTEVHHMQKLDAPSGTAITLAEQIIANHDNYSAHFCKENNEEAVDNGINITALREPEVPGTHIINYKSEIDTITIKHEAHNRKGFALGAVVAAEWIHDKKGVFTMQDVLNF
ncbi:4-hydroxy-tetrahydrodipicolinate reductase [Lishizhenia sp.]|uniref:4-hydroxy-tetrahydrodipicolinate reductase n=1 Tax=Lishizhenia sp. TaxID=2497594 RepID=UPI00299E92FC|nr:4-hydroxy-tetrahydrodipicolinate reductase [Lishizhenia sp.]MDX1446934.1 4-hydroxy-tetrahydrodipicolinate reductase [Lishizhenia sp.]